MISQFNFLINLFFLTKKYNFFYNILYLIKTNGNKNKYEKDYEQYEIKKIIF